MTDEQIIREALKTVTDYSHRHPDDKFDINECIQQTIFSVERIWRADHHTWRPFAGPERREMDELLLRIKDELSARAYLKANACLKDRMVLRVNRTNAEALLKYELGRKGYVYFFDWQMYRVKVSVKLKNRTGMTFIVKYRDIREGKLPEILENTGKMIDDINQAAGSVSVWQMRLEDWERWK